MGEIEKEAAKAFGELSSELYKDGLKPIVSQGGTLLGEAMEWAFQATYRMRLGNFRRRLEFERNKKMLEESYASIPEAKRIEVAPEISVPLLERLSYTSSEKLAELFINLLNKASNSDTAGEAHPAYLKIIESLSVDEAKILHQLNGTSELHYTGIKVFNPEDDTYVFAHNHITWITKAKDWLDFPENALTYLSHFVGLGILKDMASAFKVNAYQYQLLEKDNQDLFLEAVEKYKELRPGWKVDWAKSYFEITPFGQSFMKACVPMPIMPTLSVVRRSQPD